MKDSQADPKRSKIMKSIRSVNTSIEVDLRKELWRRGYRYRKNYKGLPGKPDIVLTKYKIAIFCDSEFFHGKDWEKLKSRISKGKNSEYWVRKIERNMERDRLTDQQLRFLDWTVIHFWGDEIKQDVKRCADVVEETIYDLALMNRKPDRFLVD